MIIRSFVTFLRDERGTYTLWSLMWFMMYVAIGGLAVDGTDGYRTKTLLQSTADASALAGVMSVRAAGEDPVAMALAYAAANMDPTVYGTVLVQEDVHVGTWDATTEAFTAGTADPNAVYVITRRAEDNGNPLIMNMLRILQLWGLNPWFNVNADALAVVGLELCQNNGIIAGGVLDLGNGSEFYNGMCLHGVEGIKVTEMEYADPDVVASVGCSQDDQHCLRPNEDLALSDPYFAQAFDLGGYDEDREPVNAQSVDTYIDMVIDLATNPAYEDFDHFDTMNSTTTVDYSGLAYLADGSGETLHYKGSSLPPDAVTSFDAATSDTAPGKYKVYEIECPSNTTLELPNGYYRNMAIISTCPIQMSASSNVNMKDVMIAVDWWSGPNPTTQFGMHFAGNAVLGATECGQGGVDLMTTNSSVHFAAGGQVNNSRLLSGWNAKMTAGASGVQGLHVEAVNDVTLVNGGTFGLCPLPADMVPQHLVYTLMR